jgi:FMN phosphatase YigB (HAD superfamily)
MSASKPPQASDGLRRYLRDQAVRQPRLWQRVVFVDWHGVLCDQPFWQSITQNPRHQQHRKLSEAVERLFRERRSLIEAWMRGSIDSQRVVGELPEPRDRRCRPNYLYRRLFDDCEQMRPRADLLDALAGLPPLTLIVIATDNMDCFSDSLPHVNLNRVFDATLCSSDLGVLKAEDPQRFFGELLAEHDLRPTDAALIDDSNRNCSHFERFGGHAIHFRNVPQAAAELQRWARCA